MIPTNNFKLIKPIPPRRFPKQQYQKLGHHIWALIIGIIIIIILAGALFMTATKFTNHQTIHHVANHVKSSRPIRRPKPVHHNQRQKTSNVTPEQGEKLLGHWLNKLHYPPDKSKKALIIYQKSNLPKEKVWAQQLTNHQQPNQVKKLINHNLIK